MSDFWGSLLSTLGIGGDQPQQPQAAPSPTGGLLGVSRPQVPTWDEYNKQRQSFSGLLSGMLSHGIGPGIGSALAPDAGAMEGYNSLLGQGQTTEMGRLNLAPWERQAQQQAAPQQQQVAPDGAPPSPMMARSPVGVIGGATGQYAPQVPGAPQQPGGAGDILSPVSLAQRLAFLSQSPEGLKSAMQLYPILDNVNKTGTGIDANGNIYRLGGANSADYQRSEATAAGEAKYKILASLAGQSGRAVQIEPGGSVATGFQNMPPEVAAAFNRVLGGGPPSGVPLSGPPSGGSAPAPNDMDPSGIVKPPGLAQATTPYNPGFNDMDSSGMVRAAPQGAAPRATAAAPGQNAIGFPTQPRSEGGRLQNPTTLEGATMQKTVLPAQFEKAGQDYHSAQTLSGQLDMMDHSIEALNQTGWSATGPGANMKLGAIDKINSLYTSLGKEPPFNPATVANWTDFNKESVRAGFELAKTLGSREAAMIVQQAVGAVPNAENSYLGARLVSSSLRQASQRQMDYYEYLTDYAKQRGGSTFGADIAFNKANPVKSYTNKAIVNALPDGAADYLRAHPDTADVFKSTFHVDPALILGK